MNPQLCAIGFRDWIYCVENALGFEALVDSCNALIFRPYKFGLSVRKNKTEGGGAARARGGGWGRSNTHPHARNAHAEASIPRWAPPCPDSWGAGNAGVGDAAKH